MIIAARLILLDLSVIIIMEIIVKVETNRVVAGLVTGRKFFFTFSGSQHRFKTNHYTPTRPSKLFYLGGKTLGKE